MASLSIFSLSSPVKRVPGFWSCTFTPLLCFFIVCILYLILLSKSVLNSHYRKTTNPFLLTASLEVTFLPQKASWVFCYIGRKFSKAQMGVRLDVRELAGENGTQRIWSLFSKHGWSIYVYDILLYKKIKHLHPLASAAEHFSLTGPFKHESHC